MCPPNRAVRNPPLVGENSILTTSNEALKERKSNEFYWSYTDEPHSTRRREILAKYPEIKKLFGYDPNFKYVTMLPILTQFFMMVAMRNQIWPIFVLVAYVVGGTCNHMLLLAGHELSHNLGFKNMFHNRLFGLFANLPIGVPSTVRFRWYHMEHHRYQGEETVDVDLPTEFEAQFFRNAPLKATYLFFHIFFYALRPLFLNNKPTNKLEVANVVCAIGFDFLVYYNFGIWALFYLLLSTLLGTGLHPCAGHFIAEHYVFAEGHETYSYYGILNIFAYNVGYHNEHHDFPFIPGSRLPQVRAIAPEFYETLPQHSSWVKVLYDFVMDPNIGLYSRVKRNTLNEKQIERLKKNQ